MTITWYLGVRDTLAGAETSRTFAEWGLAQPRLAYRSADFDTFSVVTVNKQIDGAPPITAGQFVRVWKVTDPQDNTAPVTDRYFEGRVILVKGSGDNTREQLQIEAASAWWYLDKLPYQQVFKVLDPPGNANNTYRDEYESHLYLGQRLTASTPPAQGFFPLRITVGQQITDILAYCLAQAAAQGIGAPFQYNAAEIQANDFLVPLHEANTLTCAECIRHQLRWLFDAVAWFDHSTTPPTFRVQRRSVLPALTIDLAGRDLTQINIVPRSDLVSSVVAFTYEITNGSGFRTTVNDFHPPTATGREFDALRGTFPFRGASSSGGGTSITADFTTEDFPNWDTPADVTTWIKNKLAWTNSPNIRDFVVTEVFPVDRPPVGTYELVSGTVPSWTGVTTARQNIAVRVSFDLYFYGEADECLREVTIYYTCTTTDQRSGSFVSEGGGTVVNDPGEAVPVGLAQKIHSAVSVLNYDGSLTLAAEEVRALTGTIGLSLGRKLNLSGGAVAWATMASQIQAIDLDLNSGAAGLTFGVPPHLSAGDYIELLRVARERQLTSSSLVQAGSSVGSSESVTLDSDPVLEDSAAHLARRECLRIAKYGPQQGGDNTTNIAQGFVFLDASALQTEGAQLTVRDALADSKIELLTKHLVGANKFARFQPWVACFNGQLKTVYVLATDPE